MECPRWHPCPEQLFSDWFHHHLHHHQVPATTSFRSPVPLGRGLAAPAANDRAVPAVLGRGRRGSYRRPGRRGRGRGGHHTRRRRRRSLGTYGRHGDRDVLVETTTRRDRCEDSIARIGITVCPDAYVLTISLPYYVELSKYGMATTTNINASSIPLFILPEE